MCLRLFIAASLLLLCVPGFTAGPIGTQPGQPYGDDGSVYLTDQVAQAIADTGAGYVRINIRLGASLSDTPQWYAAYDQIIDRLRSRGLEVIALMTNEAWHGGSDLQTANAYETTGGDGWNSYLNDWCNFFLRAATHWQGKIKYWELWNEPDCLAVIYPSNYGALLAHAYDLVHTNNVPVEIISGGVCGGGAPYGGDYIRRTYDVSINHTGWFTQMKNKWGTYPLDHIGFHIYPNYNTTLDQNWLSQYMDNLHSTYAAYEGANTTKKMWLTEIGWQAPQDVSESRQASNITGMCKVADSKSYIKCVTYFFLQDQPAANLNFGVFRSTGLSDADKKQGWTALHTGSTYEGRWSVGGTVDQPILNYFNSNGHANVGNPYNNGGTAWVHNWDYGPVQDYDGGSFGRMIIFDASDGSAYAVRDPFLSVILANHTALEFPLGDQFSTGSGLRQNFEGGYVTWTSASGANVSLYTNKMIQDNSDAAFSASANWTSTSTSDSYLGSSRIRKGTAVNSDPAVWTLPIPHAGSYDVYVRYPTMSGATTAASYEVVTSTGTSTVSVNQQSRGGRWNRLGNYSFAAGSAVIRLSSQGASTDNICADAVRLIEPLQGQDLTPPSVPVITDDGAYTTIMYKLNASWTSEDMESGIDHYEYAVGTSPTDTGSGYLVPWTSTGMLTSASPSITLQQGVTYYFYVKAYNNVGLMSEGVSDGIKVDVSPPLRPTVTLDGDYTADPNMIHCTWYSSDPESGIAGYEYSIGTSAYAGDIVPLTSAGTATQAWVEGLNLIPETTYYFNVRATNGAGKVSLYNYATGIRYQPGAAVNSIADALTFTDGAVVLLKNKMVVGSFLNCFYLEELDRTSGVGVVSSKPVFEGCAVDVSGTLSTVNGQRLLTTGAVTPVP